MLAFHGDKLGTSARGRRGVCGVSSREAASPLLHAPFWKLVRPMVTDGIAPATPRPPHAGKQSAQNKSWRITMRIRRSRSRRQLRFRLDSNWRIERALPRAQNGIRCGGNVEEIQATAPPLSRVAAFSWSVNRLRIVKHLPWRFIATLGRRCSCSASITRKNSQSPGLAVSRRLTGAPAKRLPRRPTWPSSQHCLRSLLSPANISNRQGQLASRRLTEAPAKRIPSSTTKRTTWSTTLRTPWRTRSARYPSNGMTELGAWWRAGMALGDAHYVPDWAPGNAGRRRMCWLSEWKHSAGDDGAALGDGSAPGLV